MDKDRTHHWETHGRSNDIEESTPMDKVNSPNVFEPAKEEIEAVVETIHSERTPDHVQHAKKDGAKKRTGEPQHKKKTHHKETHGMSDDTDEDTIHPKDKSNSKAPKKKDGFWGFLAKLFEKCCCPHIRKRD
ncbi:hypothetical protein OPV22_033786 [Ensete ventricosum]|uniref:Uncharacterized protein n=2 Tax=Ensete ventricosum TaxID=4639 RepID=A0A427AD61_ENSVE|nr:hypothetical protein OPV22_033786 [Ensete ventricosum]RRT74081.1 hypothetical protein B296_00031405 [Ensete ventricosum]RWV98046.1 hypothetical protein GW17_00039130 [Ensete ventricosum]